MQNHTVNNKHVHTAGLAPKTLGRLAILFRPFHPRDKCASKMGITERIQDIEAEMARTQKNKATEGHLGRLKAQLAKLR